MPRTSRVPVVVIAVLALVAWAPPAARAAAVLHVPADYATIQAAISAASPGDTVMVAAGTYHERISVTESITVESEDGPATTTIDGDQGGTTVSIHADWFGQPVVRGFTITGGRGTFGGGVSILGQGDVTLAGNVIRDNAGEGSGGGVLINGGGSSVIEGNVIVGNESQEGAGVSMFNAMTPTLRNNVIAGNAASGLGGGIYSSVPSGSTGPSVRNNTIAANTAVSGTGIYAVGFDIGALFQNNIVTDSGAAISSAATVDCSADYDGAPPQLVANDVWNPSGDEYGGACAGTTGTSGNVSLDPHYAALVYGDPSNGDYHLRADSPLIDTGQPDATVATDIDGDARPHDGDEDGSAEIDPGADEATDPVLVAPGNLYVGNVDVTSSGLGNVTLGNFGSAPMTFASLVIGGANADEYSIAGEGCTQVPIAVGDTCTVSLAFAPVAIGIRTAVLTISGPGPVGEREVPISGEGIDPVLVVPPSIDFGQVTLPTVTPPATVSVSFYGEPDATISSVTVTGDAAADFTVTDETCTDAPIADGVPCEIDVAFSPSAAGARTATLAIEGPWPVGPRAVALSGEGISPASGVTWPPAMAASPKYTWSYGGALGRTIQSGTQRLHLVYSTDRINGSWATDSGPYVGAYYVRSTTGSTWSTPKRLNPSKQHATIAALAASGSRVYAAWVTQTRWVKFSPKAPRVLYVRVNTKHGDGSAWKSAIRLSAATGRADRPTLAASGDDVHVAWTDGNTGSIRVATSRDRGATWSKVSLGTSSIDGAGGRSGIPSVAVSGATVLVAWIADPGGTVKARISTNRGSSWAPAVTLGSQAIDVDAAARGSRLGVAWATPDDVVLSLRHGSDWGPPLVIASLTPGADSLPYGPALAFQDSNRVGVAWSELNNAGTRSDLDWAESADGGTVWYATQVVADSASSSSRRVNDAASVVWPVAASRLVAWNGYTGGTANYRMYLRKGGGAPTGPLTVAAAGTLGPSFQGAASEDLRTARTAVPTGRPAPR